MAHAMLPGFPLQFWTQNVMVEVAHAVGNIIFLDNKMWAAIDKRITYILVEFNLHKGLLEEIEIKWGGDEVCATLGLHEYSFPVPFLS